MGSGKPVQFLVPIPFQIFHTLSGTFSFIRTSLLGSTLQKKNITQRLTIFRGEKMKIKSVTFILLGLALILCACSPATPNPSDDLHPTAAIAGATVTAPVQEPTVMIESTATSQEATATAENTLDISIAAQTSLIITLERTACFGTCPIYTLKIYANGMVIYNGQDFVSVKGLQNSSITPDQLKELVADFQNVDYFNLPDQYTAPVTDLPSTITSFSFDGKTKTVTNYGGCLTGSPEKAPQALCDLEKKIDTLTNSAQWTGKP
jgi:hypothetical protein